MLIDWGHDGQLPSKIWSLIDLCGLPSTHTATYKEFSLEQSVYAVVETANFDEDDNQTGLSEIFVPIIKEIGGLTNNAVSHMKFVLADVDAIVQAIAVVPDIGGKPNAYFWVKDCETWRTDFMDFLERPLDLEDEITMDEEDEA